MAIQKAKGIKWWILYGITGLVDGIQLLIGWTGIGTIISEMMELAMPFIIIGYFQFILKVSLFNRPIRIASLLGLGALDVVTGGVAPFWVADVWLIQRDVKKEDAELSAQEEESELLENRAKQPLNQDGVRQPRPPVITESGAGIGATRNMNGIRPSFRDISTSRTVRGNIQPASTKETRPNPTEEVSLSE